MKTTLLAAIAVLTTSSAYATVPNRCAERVDHGYSAEFSSDGASVQITLTTLVDTKVVANLRCSESFIAPPSSHSVPHLLVSCSEEFLRDAGYFLAVVADSSGTTEPMGSLFEISFMGSKKIADLPCE